MGIHRYIRLLTCNVKGKKLEYSKNSRCIMVFIRFNFNSGDRIVGVKENRSLFLGKITTWGPKDRVGFNPPPP